MQSVTYSQLVSRAVYDTQNIKVSSDEWLVRINDAYREYWNLINNLDQLYNLTSYTITTESDTAEYSWPTDFFLLKGMDADFANDSSFSSVNRINIEPVPFEYRNSFRNNYYVTAYPNGPYYRIDLSETFILVPTPPAGILLLLWYLPVNTTLVDGSTVNGINGFDVFISALAAKAVLDSRNQPSISLDQRIADFRAFLKVTVGMRDRDKRKPIIRRELIPTQSWGGGTTSG